MRHRRPHAFTLIEILIVVIILGILATIVIALFSNNSADASAKALKGDLQTMRNQVQVYHAQHGIYPSLSDFQKQMILYSDRVGDTSNARDSLYCYGPYIMEMPRLPVGTNKGLDGVTSAGSYTAGFGWAYDPLTGQFKANLPATDVDNENVPFNTY